MNKARSGHYNMASNIWLIELKGNNIKKMLHPVAKAN